MAAAAYSVPGTTYLAGGAVDRGPVLSSLSATVRRYDTPAMATIANWPTTCC